MGTVRASTRYLTAFCADLAVTLTNKTFVGPLHFDLSGLDLSTSGNTASTAGV